MYGKIKSKLPNVRKWVSIEVHCTSHLTVFYFIICIIVGNMMLPSLCVYMYTGDSHHWKCKCFSYRWVKFALSLYTGRYMSLLLNMNISVLLVIIHFLILSI